MFISNMHILDEDTLYDEQSLDNVSLPLQLQNVTENIMYYIAGYIVKHMQHINCDSCFTNLTQSPQEHGYAHTVSHAKFLDNSNNGGLMRPSPSVFTIILATEKQIRTSSLTKLTIKNLVLKIMFTVRQTLSLQENLFPDLSCKVEFLEDCHKIKLINAITYRYIKIRLFSYAKFYNQEILQPIRKRHRPTKQILFANQ